MKHKNDPLGKSKMDNHDLKLMIINSPMLSVDFYAKRYGCSRNTVLAAMRELNIQRSKRPVDCIG